MTAVVGRAERRVEGGRVKSGRAGEGALARTLFGLGALLLAGCAGAPGEPVAVIDGMRPPAQWVPDERITPEFRQLDGWGRDDHAQAVPALRRTCDWVRRMPDSKEVGVDRRAGTAADWRPLCALADRLPAGDMEAARLYFEANFTPVPMHAHNGDGLFTGYYEPILNGSWQRTERFNVPLYRKPDGWRGRLPNRAAITGGALAGRGLELMWVDDPVDAFFLEIQGSGRVRMTDGSMVGLSYGGQNGHAYFPIGRHLIDIGAAPRERMSLQFIREWLAANPDQATAVKNLNPSYVFFRLRGGGEPRGARDMELTAGRSLAVDPDFIPLGPPMWIELTEAPVPGGAIRRLVLAQDTGGAIKGPVRGDLFWGMGDAAKTGAGLMRARGRYHMLAPRVLRGRTQSVEAAR